MRNRLKRLLGQGNLDVPKQYTRIVKFAEEREDGLRDLGDAKLTEAAESLGKRLSKSAEADSFSDDDLAELCALGREVARRSLDQRAFDVQLIGALGLLGGIVIQMNTGEGKTLVGALAAVGYALAGRRVHVVSVNDYLARRDADWMGPIFRMLGVSVGWIESVMSAEDRRKAYQCDVVYAPINELGFDVLRDRMVNDIADRVTTEPDVIIVDEADSVLVDQARVPLVLAGNTDEAIADVKMVELVRTLEADEHYQTAEDGRSVSLTETGEDKVEEALGGIELYSEDQDEGFLTRVNLALHAEILLHRDVDYIVRDEKVHLIDDSRGRIALLQRWPDGLQAAVEAKEGLNATSNGHVLDQLTVPSLARSYRTVAGMTGTALGAAEQLEQMYNATVLVIPPNRPCIREDEEVRLYTTLATKQAAIVEEITYAHDAGRPVLIGTLDIAESERLAKALAEAEVEAVILNAKNDAEEAGIVAEAGALDAVTVSTQMAGRGTDIRLGGTDGDPEDILDLGGLLVIGTSPHASSRLDEQLSGRAGRQGDPGGSVFFASLEDTLIEQFGEFVRPPKGDETGRVWDSRARWRVGHAQRAAEGVNLEIHRNTWRYNLLTAQQRTIVLERREEILTDEDYSNLERDIRLYYLDQAWADHLALLTDLRESIHLRALAGGNPIDYFNRESISDFDGLLDDAEASAEERLEFADDDATMEGLGLYRPTATWTYLVQDNPLGSGLDRIVKRLQKVLGQDQ